VSYQVGYVPAPTASTSTAPPSTIAGTTTG
jgi:hypothetical protein